MINIPKFHFLPVIGRSFGKIEKDPSLSLSPFLVPRLLFERSKEKTREKRVSCLCFYKTQRLITFLVAACGAGEDPRERI